MRITYCIRSLNLSGGTERVLTTKANWLVNHGIEVFIIVNHGKGTPYFKLSEKVRLIALNSTSRKELHAGMKKVLFDIKPDVTICVDDECIDHVYKIKDGSAKIMEFHYTRNFLINYVKHIRKLRFKKLHLLKVWLIQEKIAYYSHRYDKVIGLTKRDIGLWGNPSNMTYIYNPLSFRSEKKSTCEEKKIIAVGSFTPAKGMDQLIEAFALIAKKYPDWQVDIYGQGNDKNLLIDMIRQKGLEDQVHLHAPTSDIADKLIEASIYAFPSRSDGFGLVITEAMECGLPVVAMDCQCGPREIVTPETGILVPDKDIQEYAQALKKLISNPDLRKELGNNAQEQVKRFYVDSIMPRWIKLFHEVTSSGDY